MRPRRGLTLVELLSGLAIAAMLAAAALGVTTALARSELALRRAQAGPETLGAALKALLEMDLVHAHHWRAVEGGFALQTTARLTGPTLRLEHVPAEVTYRVVRAGDSAYLVR
ncbi:MAG: prepilin-type N-terminal cleavage/methylation domain-containing protein, partial [Planctomycetes bacterium]|nr:prepilin-type N-terminal cleavage/methylation domain-containing protein [Planctomycetota bacterium]